MIVMQADIVSILWETVILVKYLWANMAAVYQLPVHLRLWLCRVIS